MTPRENNLHYKRNRTTGYHETGHTPICNQKKIPPTNAELQRKLNQCLLNKSETSIIIFISIQEAAIAQIHQFVYLGGLLRTCMRRTRHSLYTFMSLQSQQK